MMDNVCRILILCAIVIGSHTACQAASDVTEEIQVISTSWDKEESCYELAYYMKPYSEKRLGGHIQDVKETIGQQWKVVR